MKHGMLAVLSVCLSVLAAGTSRAAEGAPVLMMGDSMMRLLDVAMEKELKAAGIQPAVSFSALGSSLIRSDLFDWYAKTAALLKEHKPATVVITLGKNDRQTLKTPDGQLVPYGSPAWEAAYGKYVGRVMDELIQGGVQKVIWLLLPDMKEPALQEYAQAVNTVFMREAAAETRKDKVSLFDVRPLLTRRPGTYSAFVMAADGAALSVRDVDGVHLSAVGAERVARSLVKTYWK
ncbi:MAG: DUF459 domain-containing protein [Verrucomicrobiota bacterium]|jgi:hypothetical protein|nr:DUF459 domain-containing protein [Verrucomicrobiota bacterium]